ncbi:uncharacterized protein E5676_scaffold21G003560 [Cucumis melo var. makuwa]|uniref:Uncharacterized protein n=1 Tax=Cucumis melo var. makuwa TaxID=1194695 RepID=A0A5D3CYV3_CUCMM|nr:uncharacterized protein E6C27_scaffold74G002290 [Cucumis melo var. makuwa]TYK16540.1 uncharacterized protein E5676_scaffold21G003560 [Cucumis melo var. makuwa]
MDVCFEDRFEELDRTNAMNILTILVIDSAAFSARSSTHDNEKNNGKWVPITYVNGFAGYYHASGHNGNQNDPSPTTLGVVAQPGLELEEYDWHY